MQKLTGSYEGKEEVDNALAYYQQELKEKIPIDSLHILNLWNASKSEICNIKQALEVGISLGYQTAKAEEKEGSDL